MKTFSLLGFTLLASIAGGVFAGSDYDDSEYNEYDYESANAVVCDTCEAAPYPSAPTQVIVPAGTGIPTGVLPTGTGAGQGGVATNLPPLMAGANGNSLYVGASGLVALAMGIVLAI
ncbi:hypothetical protein E4U21_004600 [Claviceps maximensis]|nr:hypothetical protein E4U21_004600 [Claviceps maximensis]